VARGLLMTITGASRPLSLIDVEDCARGLLALAERPEAVGQAFFLASGERTDLEGLQRMVARAVGVEPRVVRLPPAALSAAAFVADGITRVTRVRLPLNRKLARQILAPGWTCDPGKAARLLGFEARTPLADSVGRAARWYLDHGWM